MKGPLGQAFANLQKALVGTKPQKIGTNPLEHVRGRLAKMRLSALIESEGGLAEQEGLAEEAVPHMPKGLISESLAFATMRGQQRLSMSRWFSGSAHSKRTEEIRSQLEERFSRSYTKSQFGNHPYSGHGIAQDNSQAEPIVEEWLSATEDQTAWIPETLRGRLLELDADDQHPHLAISMDGFSSTPEVKPDFSPAKETSSEPHEEQQSPDNAAGRPVTFHSPTLMSKELLQQESKSGSHSVSTINKQWLEQLIYLNAIYGAKVAEPALTGTHSGVHTGAAGQALPAQKEVVKAKKKKHSRSRR